MCSYSKPKNLHPKNCYWKFTITTMMDNSAIEKFHCHLAERSWQEIMLSSPFHIQRTILLSYDLSGPTTEGTDVGFDGFKSYVAAFTYKICVVQLSWEIGESCWKSNRTMSPQQLYLVMDLVIVLRPPFCIFTIYFWLNWLFLAWKKSQRTLDTSKKLHQNKNWSTRSADKGLDSQLCHWELRTRESAGASRLKASHPRSMRSVGNFPQFSVVDMLCDVCEWDLRTTTNARSV